MKKIIYKILSLTMALLLSICSLLSGTGVSAQQTASERESIVNKDTGADIYYWELLDEYEQSGYRDFSGKDIEISLQDAVSGSMALKYAETDGKNALIWDADIEEISWTVSVPEDALYSIEIDYYAINDRSTDIQRGMELDGELLCMEWSNLVFTRLFEDSGQIRVDSNGDESAPGMVQIYSWQTVGLSDYNGYFSGPMRVYLSQGEHTLTFMMNGNQPMAIGGLRLTAPEDLIPYSELEKLYEEEGYKPAKQSYECEAESTLNRSSSSMRLVADSDLSCNPSSMSKTVINCVGGSYWKSSRQTITWELSVPEDGLYQLSFDLYSYYNYGLPVYRRICIDGSVPFAEMTDYCFMPSTKWRTESLSDNHGNPYYFYLTEGRHTLSMSVVSGRATEIIRRLTDDMDILSDLYLSITMITTSDPDPYYDYELSSKIPDLMDTMQSLYDNLGECADVIKEVCGNEKALTYGEIQNTMEDLRILMDDEFEIPSNIDQFTTMLSSYGTWISELKAGTMTLDRVVLSPAEAEIKTEKVSIFKKIARFFVSFISTFTKDYNAVIGDGEVDESGTVIDVWYGGTQIWAAEIQDIIETDFVKDTGIQVRFKLTPASQMSTGINAMLLSIMSGTAPDVIISAASVEDYAMRNQCYDLRQFDDFEEIAARFPEDCIIPLTYQNKTFGLPLTMDVKMMFYRTDIFEELEIEVPKTWDDMISKVIPKLSENSMALASSPGYETLLFQNGGELYNGDMTESAIASQLSWEAFKLHCDFYNMYGVPKSADFFNRFRTGESPVGFGGLADYIKFIYAAPELVGRWSVALMPGTVQEDGTVSHNIGRILSSSAMMLADAKHPHEGWEFLKWYTETNTQLTVSERMEAKLDMSARLISANIEAFESLDWDRDDIKVFKESLKETKAYNPVLGSYYTTRYINYAYNYVVISKTMTEREALEYAQKNINKELSRRRNSLS